MLDIAPSCYFYFGLHSCLREDIDALPCGHESGSIGEEDLWWD